MRAHPPPRPLSPLPPSHPVSAAQRTKGAAVRGSSDTQLKLLSGRRAAPKRKVQKISGLGHPALAPVNVGERRVPPHLNSSLAPPNHLKITHTTIRRSHPSAHRGDGGKKGGNIVKSSLEVHPLPHCGCHTIIWAIFVPTDVVDHNLQPHSLKRLVIKVTLPSLLLLQGNNLWLELIGIWVRSENCLKFGGQLACRAGAGVEWQELWAGESGGSLTEWADKERH